MSGEAVKSRRGPHPRFSIDEVLDAAERLPYDKLTMAALGAELGLATSALYRYVRDRDDLLAKVTARVAGDIVVPDWDLPWDEWLRHMAVGFYDLVLAHPVLADSAWWPLMSTDGVAALIATGEATLKSAGFRRVDALHLLASCAHLGISLATSQLRAQAMSPVAVPTDEGGGPAWPALTTADLLSRTLTLVLAGAQVQLSQDATTVPRRSR